jgi:hypothetical protein
MAVLQVFREVLVFEANIHSTSIPFARLHPDLNVVVGQETLIDHDGTCTMMLFEHGINHGNLR